MVIKGFVSESRHRYGYVITNYTRQEIDELRSDWKNNRDVRLIIGPDDFSMIWFDTEEDKNWFLLKWKSA